MLSNRIIPVLLLSSGKLVKTQRFSDPKYVGDPVNAIRIFNELEQTDAECLSSILFVCSISSPSRYKEAIMILHTSDIVHGARGPGFVETEALSYAVIACSKENQWEVSVLA